MTGVELAISVLSGGAVTGLLTHLFNRKVVKANVKKIEADAAAAAVAAAKSVVEILERQVTDMDDCIEDLKKQNAEQQKLLDQCVTDRGHLHRELDEVKREVEVLKRKV